MMKNIITITMSPTVDKSTVAPMIVPDKKLRCDTPVFEPGGGGINVARAINKLGGKATAAFPSGGHTGSLLQDLLEEEGVPQINFTIDKWTRENFIVVDAGTKQQYRFGFPGAEMTETEVSNFIKLIENLEPVPDYIIMSGSMPPGLSSGFCAQIADISKKFGSRLIIDTSDEALREALKVGVYLIKPNINELSSLAGKEELSHDEVETEAKKIIATGKCEVLAVSLGAAGALMITSDETLLIPAPTAPRRSTVGAGDSMVGGIVHYLSQGKSVKEAVCYGVAAGTAATMNPGTALCKKEDTDKLYEWIVCRVNNMAKTPAL